MEDYKFDFTELDKERPIGVSGLMRVKNDGEFVAASIDSCIDALDELIIVYDDSDDNTEEEIRNKQKENPEKIKIYHYEPEIFSHNLDDSRFQEVLALPLDSEHLLANYYNWTMSRASYRYCFKIDADQIYFTSKLKFICGLYRSTNKEKICFREIISYWNFRVFSKLCVLFPQFLTPRTSKLFIGMKKARRVQSYVYKRIQNEKIVTSFSGINLFFDGNVKVPLGKFYDGVQPPINGSGDHIFFKPSSYNKYVVWPQKEYHRIIEIMTPHERMYFGGGFLWLHMNAMRKNIYEINKIKYKRRTIELDNFLKDNFFKTEREYGFKISISMRPVIYLSLLADRKEIEENVKKYNHLFG